MKILQKQNARADIRRYVQNQRKMINPFSLSFIRRLLQIHPDLISDLIEQSSDEQRQELTRILNSKTIN